MKSRHQEHYDNLVRRRDHLAERLLDYEGGNPEPTRRELSTMRWVVDLIGYLDREGILEDVAR